MRKRRRFVKGEVYFITNRLCEGLPFLPNLLICYLINGIIARAIELYPGVELCAFLFMGNHYHAVVVLNASAEQMAAFFGYIDGEIASLFHRLMGIAHRKFWTKRYHPEPILNPHAVIEKILYCFLNPVRANLVDRAVHWQGASSLPQFLDNSPRYYRWISSSLVEKLPHGPLSEGFIKKTLAGFEKSKRAPRELRVNPYCWKGCFEQSQGWSDKQISEKILTGLRVKEEEYRKERLAKGKRVLGVERLCKQSIYQRYMSKEYGRSNLCISDDKEEREEYAKIYKAFCELCREVWEAWKRGDLGRKFPPGAFIPPLFPLASIFEPA